MKPKLNRWSPVTCECNVIEYTDENGAIRFVTQAEAIEIHRQIFADFPNDTVDPDKFPQLPTYLCPAHSSIGETENIYNTLMEEGGRCMGTLRALQGLEGTNYDLYATKINLDGTSSVDIKPGVDILWQWSGTGTARTLQVSVTGQILTSIQKTSLRNFCNTRFGLGKVIIS